MMTWLLLAVAIASEVAATMSLKGALDRPALYAVVAVGYPVSFILLAAILRRGMGLGVTYGIWGAAGVAATAILSTVVFGESLTLVMWVGLALIISGVVLVQGGSQAAHGARARPAQVATERPGVGPA